MRTWFRRLAYLLRQSRHEAELREEIELHRSLRAEQLERDGLTPQEAADASRRAIGNVLLAREDAREVWLGSRDAWWQDVRYGLRTFRRSPTFTAVAVLTLGLGIGVNAGIFTVLNGVLFRDLPVPNARELVSIAQTVRGRAIHHDHRGRHVYDFRLPRLSRSRADAFRPLAHSDPRETTLGGETPQEIFGMIVSCNYFAVLQEPPALGRALTAQDCEPDADPVVVLGHNVWTTTFAADPGILGRTSNSIGSGSPSSALPPKGRTALRQ